jgi:hypothetical protein
VSGRVRPERAHALCAAHFPDEPLLPGDVAVYVDAHRGQVRFDTRLERRLAHFWRCRCEARAPDGRVLLTSRVTLAADRSAERR